MNFYPFHIGDYASATRHLSWLEDAAYRRLLDVYYVKEHALPLDKRQIYRLVVASENDQRQAVDVVLEEFFSLTDGGYVHDRCEAEISAAVSKREKASQSAKTRWGNTRPADVALPSESECNANALVPDADACKTTCESNAPNPNPNPNPNPKVNPSNPNGLLVAGDPATLPCPHQEIINTYHEVLPSCPRVREWTAGRQKILRSRWSENPKRQTIGWWRKYFAYVSESEFLTGRGSCAPGRDPFVADLEWLIRPTNFVKVIEGRYHGASA